MSRLVAVLALLATVLVARSASADACFTRTEKWGTGLGMPVVGVWLATTTAGTAIAPIENAGMTVTAAEAGIRRAIALWNEDSGARLKLSYRGKTTSNFVSGGIVVHGAAVSTHPRTALATASIAGTVDGHIDTAAITFYRRAGAEEPVITWTNDGEGGAYPGATDITLVMIHELGHAVHTMRHPGEDGCPATVTSVMNVPYPNGGVRVLSLYDRTRAQLKHGRRHNLSELYWKNWGSGVWGGVQSVKARILYRAGSATQNATQVAIAHQDIAAKVLRSAVRVFSGTSLIPTASSTITGGGHTPSAVASNGGSGVLLATLEGETLDYEWAHLCYRLSSDGGRTFGAQVCPVDPIIGSFRTRRQGVTAGYDPRSRAYLVPMTLDDGGIRVVTIPDTAAGSTVPLTYTTLAPEYRSWDAASVACKDAANGCRIAWVDKTANGYLRWLEASVDATTGQVVPAGVARTQSITLYDTPSIAYFRADDTFRLAYHQNHTNVYAAQMSSTGTSWTAMPSVWANANSLVSSPVVSTEYCASGCTSRLRVWFVRYL